VSEQQSPARLATVVRADPPALDDPAELYHEASKYFRSTAARDVEAAIRLAVAPELQRVTARPTYRHPQRPLLPLGPAAPLAIPLDAALAGRRSARAFASGALAGPELSAVLQAGYGPTSALPEEDGDRRLRSAPSAGALYPLDVYAAAQRVMGLAPDVYRYDPLEQALEPARVAPKDVADATPYADIVEAAAVTLVLTATFWRSRFKYGQRAYRFTLLEAGHVAQNMLLAAEALGLAAVPLGGFFDEQLDAALGLDGVERSSLYLLSLGRRP
jgi:SagB-type dehydrogenase family enzyme